MPQKISPKQDWVTNSKLDYQTFKYEYKTYINKLGNFLLVRSGFNSELKSRNFIEKRDMLKTNYSSELITGRVGELMNLTTKSSFTFEDIKKRTEQLASLIAPLYKIDEKIDGSSN